MLLIIAPFAKPGAAQEAPKPKPFYRDANFWAAESVTAGGYLALGKVTTDNERGIPRNAPDWAPHSPAFNYGACAAGIGVNTALTFASREWGRNETHRFWRWLRNWAPALGSSSVIVPGTVHRAKTGRNNGW